MDLSAFYLGNSFIIHTVYLLIVLVCCIFIYAKTKRLYKISTYLGLNYFSNAFLYYGLGFLFVYLRDWIPYFIDAAQPLKPYMTIVIEYCLLMAGFFIVYSLLWKKLEDISSSLPADKILMLHGIAIIIAVVDFLKTTGYIMYIIQLVLSLYAIFITYNNYISSKKKGFMPFYFLAMILNFIGWASYFVAFFLFPFYPAIEIIIYAITSLIFIIFLLGIIKVTANGKKA